MKKTLTGILLLALSASASADFFGGNDGEWKMGPNGPYWDESDWPVWTPMYWMEEMMDSFDDDDDYNYGYGYNSNMYAQPGMYSQPMPYPYSGYGYQYQQPVAPQATAPAAPAAPKAPTTK